jgi:hypothetical protein
MRFGRLHGHCYRILPLLLADAGLQIGKERFLTEEEHH